MMRRNKIIFMLMMGIISMIAREKDVYAHEASIMVIILLVLVLGTRSKSAILLVVAAGSRIHLLPLSAPPITTTPPPPPSTSSQHCHIMIHRLLLLLLVCHLTYQQQLQQSAISSIAFASLSPAIVILEEDGGSITRQVYSRGARTKNYMCSRKGNRQYKSTAGNGATHRRDGGHFPMQTNIDIH